MTFEHFDKINQEIDERIAIISKTKGKEYSRTADRLANFKRIARKNKKLTPLDVAQVFLSKHLDGIDSFIENGQEFSEERIEGRIIDAILYLKLIYALVWELRNVEQEAGPAVDTYKK